MKIYEPSAAMSAVAGSDSTVIGYVLRGGKLPFPWGAGSDNTEFADIGMDLTSYPSGVWWRLVFRFLSAMDNLIVRYRAIEERWFDRYIKPKIEKQP